MEVGAKIVRVGIFLATAAELKTLGGLIDEYLYQSVEVFLFYARESDVALKKGAVHLTNETVPKFTNGVPCIIEVVTPLVLSEQITKSKIDLIFFHMGVSSVTGKAIKWVNTVIENNKKVKRISLASHFYDNCFLPLESYEYFDKVIVLNEQSYQVHYDNLISKNYNKDDIKKVFNEKCIIGGSPMFDSLLENNTTYHSKNTLLFMTPSFFSPFQRTVLLKDKRLASFLNLIRYPYIENINQYPSSISFYKLIKDLKNYCHTNNLIFNVKSRNKMKDYYVKEINALSDFHFNELETIYYPLTQSQKMLLESKVMVATRSFSIMESVALGVPAVNIQQPFNDKFFRKLDPNGVFRNMARGDYEYSIVNYPGCVESVKWENIQNIGDNIDCAINSYSKESRGKYIKKYINPWSDRNSSQTIVHCLE